MSNTQTRSRSIEWPTIGLIVVTYAILGLLVWFHAFLPWYVILALGAYFTALHSSLQHEVLHGHPTRNRLVNEALVFVTPALWIPFGRYRDTHLKHHNDLHLTCPVDDPESFYLLPDDWAHMPGLKRLAFQINQTLGGRMLIGPLVSVCRFWSADLADAPRRNRQMQVAWALFALSCAITIIFVVAIAGMPLWQYILLVAYPGVSLALVRSYCEHQAEAEVDHRTIIVEASPFWSLLFLNNNLHVAHHTKPTLPWYKLPAYYRGVKQELLAKNNGYTMNGYGEIFRRYLFTAKEPIPHPNLNWLKGK